MTAKELNAAVLALSEAEVRPFHAPLLRQYQRLISRGGRLTAPMRANAEAIIDAAQPRTASQGASRMAELRALLNATH